MRPRPRTSAWSKSWSSGPLRRSMRHLGPSVPHPYPGCQLSPGAAKLLKTGGKMQLAIKRGIERIPGGMVIVPLTLGALIGTFAPGTAQFFGSFTGALFTGALPILAVFYVCMGTTIPFETLPQVAGKGGVLLAAKVLMGVAAALVLGHFLGTKPVKTGLLAGLSTLAW